MIEIGPELSGVLMALAKTVTVVGVVWAIVWFFKDFSFQIKMRDPDEKGE